MLSAAVGDLGVGCEYLGDVLLGHLAEVRGDVAGHLPLGGEHGQVRVVVRADHATAPGVAPVDLVDGRAVLAVRVQRHVVLQQQRREPQQDGLLERGVQHVDEQAGVGQLLPRALLLVVVH